MVSRMPPRTPPPPLTRDTLRDLALAYVGRFATTEARLRLYLARKLRERGWAGEGEPPLEALVAKCADQGFVDDAAFGAARARSLARRGYGPRRVAANLGAAGLARAAARSIADNVDAEAAALRYAERRRFGRFGAAPPDPDAARRQFAAMLRAGHAPAIVRTVLAIDGEGDDEE